MDTFLIHLAKSSVILLAAYLVYLLLVRFTTFHYLNRSYLILSLGISLLVPFIHFPVEETHLVYAYTLPTIDIVEFSENPIEEQGFNYQYGLWLLYGLISIIFAFRLAYYLYGLMSLLYKHSKKRMGKFTLIYSNSINSAFSFFKYIVLPEHLNQQDEQLLLNTKCSMLTGGIA